MLMEGHRSHNVRIVILVAQLRVVHFVAAHVVVHGRVGDYWLSVVVRVAVVLRLVMIVGWNLLLIDMMSWCLIYDWLSLMIVTGRVMWSRMMMIDRDPVFAMLRLDFIPVSQISAMGHVMGKLTLVEGVMVHMLVYWVLVVVVVAVQAMVMVLLWVQVQMGLLTIVFVAIVLFFVVVGESLGELVVV